MNDCLLTGPPLLNDLVSIVIGFKCDKFACAADIEKAFLMIDLNSMNRDSCRFLSVGDPVNKDFNIKAYRFKVVLFGSTAIQFLLNAIIDHHLTLNPSKTSELYARSLYVDIIINTFNSESELVSFKDSAMTLIKEGIFKFRQLHSNMSY